MDILKRQKQNYIVTVQQREDAAKKQAALVAANPKPPRIPAGPLQAIDPAKGIFGMRTAKIAGRKRKHRKTRRRNK